MMVFLSLNLNQDSMRHTSYTSNLRIMIFRYLEGIVTSKALYTL